jgi:hypothetical protein
VAHEEASSGSTNRDLSDIALQCKHNEALWELACRLDDELDAASSRPLEVISRMPQPIDAPSIDIVHGP